jgi:hypothetical protein
VNFSAAPAYEVYICHLILYSRACWNHCFESCTVATMTLLSVTKYLYYNSIQNDKTINNDLQKITQKTKDRAKRTPLKTRVEPKCSGRIISSWTTSGTCRVTPVTNTVMRRERGKDREVDCKMVVFKHTPSSTPKPEAPYI